MNILYIAHEGGINYNGASRSLVSIVEKMSEQNNVFVVIPESGGKLQTVLQELRCKVKYMPFFRWVDTKSRNPMKWYKKKLAWQLSFSKVNEKYINELTEYCKTNSIDIIHSNSGVINIGAILSLRTGIPHIWHFREFGQEDFNMFPLVSRRKWINTMSQKNTKIICVSNAVRNKYQKLLPDADIRTIYNGIDFKENENYSKRDHEGFNLLISGLISEAKGQKTAIRAAIKLLDMGYEDVNLYIAGRGRCPMENEINSSYRNHFHFLGQNDNMSELRSYMDIELVCSRCEAFGRVTIEAMSCKLPVIGTRTGGTPELIKEGENGFLFEQDNIEELCDFILKLYNNRKLLKKMGKTAYESVIKKFTVYELCENLSDVYKEVL